MSENNKAIISTEEVLNNEDSLLRGLLEAGSYKDDESLRRTIRICRNGVEKFSFTVRPLDEEEEIDCYRKATPKIPNPHGRNLPYVDGKTNTAIMRSWKIYTATIDEDRQRVWNNPQYKAKKGLITPIEAIDSLLRTGDKDVVLAIIDQISGSGNNDAVRQPDDESNSTSDPTIEEYAKN